MVLPCPAAVLAGVLAIGATSLPARAGTDAPYPKDPNSKAAGPLTVVQSETGFSIQEQMRPHKAPIASNAVRLGNSLSLDSQLFERTFLIHQEINHAAKR